MMATATTNKSEPINTEQLYQLILEQNKKIEQLEQDINKVGQDDTVSLVVFSNDLDRALASFIIATGAAAMGMKVNLFFTFWGTSILKKQGVKVKGKKLVEKMFELMLPNSSKKLGLSQMNMLGAGSAMMKKIMKDQKVASLEDMIDMISQMPNVNIQICEMSMGLMGIKSEEIIGGENICGVANFVSEASKGKISMFI